MKEINNIIQQLLDEWPYPYVLRIHSKKATGGAFDWKTLRLEDHRGKGPKEKFKIGHKVGYSKESFYEWFKGKIKNA